MTVNVEIHRTKYKVVAFLFITSIITFFVSFFVFFIGDDFCLLERSQWKGFLNLFQLFLHSGYGGFYRPLPQIIYSILLRVFGLYPFVYHLVSLLFHFFCSLLVVYIANMLTRSEKISFWSGLFFSVHFSHVETIVWVGSLCELLSAFFTIAGFVIFLKSFEKRKEYLIIFSFCLFFLGLISKENSISLFPLFFLVFLFPNLRVTILGFILRVVPHGLVLFFYLWIRMITNSAMPVIEQGKSYSIIINPLTVLHNLGHFWLSMVVPLRFFFDIFGYSGYELLTEIYRNGHVGAKVITMILVIFLFLSILFLLRKSNLGVIFGILWTIITLLPYVLFEGKGERYLYLPSAGFAIVVSTFLLHLRKNEKVINTLFIILIIASFIIIQERQYWWNKAGAVVEQVLDGVGKRRELLNRRKVIYLVGIPHRIHGAHIFTECVSSAFRLYFNNPSLKVIRCNSLLDVPLEKGDIVVFEYIDGTLMVR